MFNYQNEAKVDNYPGAAVKLTQVKQKQPSINDDVMKVHRKTPSNMDNDYLPNKKAKVDYEAKASIPVAAAFNSISLDDETNGSGLSVNDQDVLCGLGKGKPHSHIGSVNYRRLVSANKVSTPSPFHVRND